MDVWVEFKNASKWQAELLFRNFFPSTDEDDVVEEGELEGIELPTTPPSPAAESASSPVSSSFSSMFSSLALGGRSRTESTASFSSFTESATPSVAEPSTPAKTPKTPLPEKLKNQTYLPPSIDDEIEQFKHSAPVLDSLTLSRLAKEFADAIPDEEFSVASLQGCKSPASACRRLGVY
jgi:mitochondrial chaperone BCS1